MNQRFWLQAFKKMTSSKMEFNIKWTFTCGACGCGCWVTGCETGLSSSLLFDAGSTSVDDGVFSSGSLDSVGGWIVSAAASTLSSAVVASTSSWAGQTTSMHLVKKGRCHERPGSKMIRTLLSSQVETGLNSLFPCVVFCQLQSTT